MRERPITIGIEGLSRETPTKGDIAALNRLMGTGIFEIVGPSVPPPGMGRWQKGMVVRIRSESDPNKTYTVEDRIDTVYGGTYLFCSCPSWKFKRGKGEDCKHITIAQRMVSEQSNPALGQALFKGMPLSDWAKYGSLTCDDCGRTDGTHNPAVEH